MKFLLNMNVPPQLGKRLALEGHLCRHVRDIGMATADDEEIVREAKIREEVIITHDLDYGHLLAFSGESHPSVIIFRLRNTHPTNLFERLKKNWSAMQQDLEQGAIVVIEDAALRIRKLPVISDNN